jgi:hypothetical protein
LSCTSSPFCSGYFEEKSCELFALGWPQTAILQISPSREIRLQT